MLVTSVLIVIGIGAPAKGSTQGSLGTPPDLGPILEARIPNGLVGSPQSEALRVLARAGYNNVHEEFKTVATTPAGQVVAVDPVSGASWPLSAVVDLEISHPAPAVTTPPRSATTSTTSTTSTTTDVPPPPPPELVVPNVVGDSQDSADAVLETAGFDTAVGHADAAAPTGTVISQNPAAGGRDPRGATVSIVVSDGPRPCPTEIGAMQSAAVTALQTAGCTVTTQSQFSSAALGTVIGQNPPPPDPVGTKVTLVVSAGPAPCPRVVGESVAAAEKTLTGDGCPFTVAMDFSPSVPAGDVISENPPAPEAKGTSVAIVVSEGPEPTVPDVVGDTSTDAGAKLSAAHYEVTMTTQPSSGPPGIVLQQTPSGGTAEPPGFTVQLVISIVETTTVPDVTADSLAIAEAALSKAGLKYEVDNPDSCDFVSGQDPAAGTIVPVGSVVVLTLGCPLG
jgi:beta-lactam-binding protein with PASTA domain